jgi:RND superfamily putative drug exporter
VSRTPCKCSKGADHESPRRLDSQPQATRHRVLGRRDDRRIRGGRTGGRRLSQQFNIPGREGYETNKDIAEIYGSGGDVAPLVPVVTLPKGTTVDSPGVTAELASALARVKQAMPDVRIASYSSTHDRSFVSDDGRTTFALVYHPAVGGVDPGQAEARKAQAALAASPWPVARPSDRDERASCGAGRQRVGWHRMLVETLLGALGALLVLIFVFRSFMAIVPLLMAAVAIPTTFLLIWPIANVTDVSVIVQFLVALIGLGIAIDYALLVVVRWREERRGGESRTRPPSAMRCARGSAVVFSGTTVAISLLSLLALPMPALRSIGSPAS